MPDAGLRFQPVRMTAQEVHSFRVSELRIDEAQGIGDSRRKFKDLVSSERPVVEPRTRSEPATDRGDPISEEELGA